MGTLGNDLEMMDDPYLYVSLRCIITQWDVYVVGKLLVAPNRSPFNREYEYP